MKLIDLTVTEFSNMVASNSPAPGGGSVSALASRLGTSLLEMVGSLTVSKKKFRNLDEDIKRKFTEIQTEYLSISNELLLLIDRDTEAFNLIMSAYQYPKETKSDLEFRNQKIQEATIEAIKVPLQVVELSHKVLQSTKHIIKYGNKNTISDIGVAILMIYAGLEGAILNVKINLSGVSNQKQKEYYTKKSNDYLEDSKKLRDQLMNLIHSML